MKNFIAAVIILFSVSVFPINAFSQSSDDVYLTEIFSTDENPDVTITTSGGFVHVYGHNRNTVRVEMFVRHRGRFLKPSEDALDDTEVEIYMDGHDVLISAKANNTRSGFWFFNWNTQKSISFKVYVPENALVNGRTSGGPVSAENLKNGVTLRTSGGPISLHNVTGITEVRTSGGPISITEVHGEVSARTSGGSISLKNASGMIGVQTSGGSISVTNISGSLDARTSGGSISASLKEIDGEISLRTSGGSISINVPDNQGYILDLRGNRVHVNLTDFSGRSDRDRVNGTVRGGGHLIYAHTSGGGVSLQFD